MEIFTFQVTGRSPGLLMHNPAAMGNGGTGMSVKKTKTPEDEARAGRYVDGKGNFYFPAQAFKSCMVSGAKGLRFNKQAAATLIRGTVFCPEDNVTILDPKTLKPLKAAKYDIDMRRVVITGRRCGVLRARPLVKSWACKVALEVDADPYYNAGDLLQAIERGSRMVGVGDFRPENGGAFGRFTVKLLRKDKFSNKSSAFGAEARRGEAW